MYRTFSNRVLALGLFTSSLSIAGLPVGHYRVAVDQTGFQTFIWDNVQLQVGQNLTLDARLEPASTSTTVT